MEIRVEKRQNQPLTNLAYTGGQSGCFLEAKENQVDCLASQHVHLGVQDDIAPTLQGFPHGENCMRRCPYGGDRCSRSFCPHEQRCHMSKEEGEGSQGASS